MKIAVFSDIHANLTALHAVIHDCNSRYPGISRVILLGDHINYGSRPNETLGTLVSFLQEREVLVSLAGNHEMELFRAEGPSTRFSTKRGIDALLTTRKLLTSEWQSYLREELTYGPQSITVESKKILCVHACISDPYWGEMTEKERTLTHYADYDYVLSGHSHIPCAVDELYSVHSPALRNMKKTVFLNPGSVGQPRNRMPLAQYMVFDPSTEEVHMNKVVYDIGAELALDAIAGMDPFYRERLKTGI
jgi:predicted phosphodiesterase